MTTNWTRLAEPFDESDIEWRIGQYGKNDRGVWAKVLAYITARAIMDRLDDVFGVGGWKNEYHAGPAGGVVCRIWFRDDTGEWVYREDGAENTDIEAVKGGISGALKRAGAALGVGRYLYKLEGDWAVIGQEGDYYVGANKDKGTPAFRWNPPPLPSWALPAGAKRKAARAPRTEEPLVTAGQQAIKQNVAVGFKAESIEWLKGEAENADNGLTTDQRDNIAFALKKNPTDKALAKLRQKVEDAIIAARK